MHKPGIGAFIANSKYCGFGRVGLTVVVLTGVGL